MPDPNAISTKETQKLEWNDQNKPRYIADQDEEVDQPIKDIVNKIHPHIISLSASNFNEWEI